MTLCKWLVVGDHGSTLCRCRWYKPVDDSRSTCVRFWRVTTLHLFDIDGAWGSGCCRRAERAVDDGAVEDGASGLIVVTRPDNGGDRFVEVGFVGGDADR